MIINLNLILQQAKCLENYIKLYKDKKINKWIFGKGEIKWNNSCQEVKVINLNGTERNISLFENPQLTKSELPLKKNNIETILNKDGVVEKNNNIFFDKEELILNKSYFIPKEKTSF